MSNNSTFIYLVAGIVLLHFLLGIGWLMYKIMYAKPKAKDKPDEETAINDK